MKEAERLNNKQHRKQRNYKMVQRKRYRDVTSELAMFSVACHADDYTGMSEVVNYGAVQVIAQLERIEESLEASSRLLKSVNREFIDNWDSTHERFIVRSKKTNKKRKVKNLLKTKSLGSCLQKVMCDSNGNVTNDAGQLSHVIFNRKKTSYLNKGKSRLHVKYNIYKRFNLQTLEKAFAKPTQRCKHVFSDAFMLKNPTVKPQKSQQENVVINKPAAFIPPPTTVIITPAQPANESYEIPNYMYILDTSFRAIPCYSQQIASKCSYANFQGKNSAIKSNVDEAVSLPLRTLEEIMSSHADVCSRLVESGILNDLLKLVCLLNGYASGQRDKITKNDLIWLPAVSATNNYHSNGTGFGTGDTNSVWSIKCTHWKHTTEKEHNLRVFKILDTLLRMLIDQKAEQLINLFVGSLLESNLISILLGFFGNTSILDISESFELYKVLAGFTSNLIQEAKLKESMAKKSGGRIIAGFVGVLDLYLSKVKDSQLLKLNQMLQEIAKKFEPPVKSIHVASAPGATDAHYCEKMRDYLFDSYKMIDGNQALVPYYYLNSILGMNSDQRRVKRIAQEFVSLSNSLPLSASSSVFVRCDEERVDVMKVLITGPEDTPYSMGCFEFDVSFPGNYPTSPPSIILKTTGLGTVRFNPNLYNTGKVCLSILNTWPGRPEEQWNEMTSTLLQVLVSIQSLIFVSEPYFNEPGLQRYFGTPEGNISSKRYNVNIIEATTKWAILEMIKNPPLPFKEAIHDHFYLKTKSLKKQLVQWDSLMRQVDGLHLNKYHKHVDELEKEMKNLVKEKERPAKSDKESNGLCRQVNENDCLHDDYTRRFEKQNSVNVVIPSINI